MYKKKFFIKTYGCDMNHYDSLMIKKILLLSGLEFTNNILKADIVILNTCHIRQKASDKIYSELGYIRKLKVCEVRNKYKLLFIVAGCVSQAEGNNIFNKTPYVNIVVGPHSYINLPKLIVKFYNGKDHLIDLSFKGGIKFDYLYSNNLSVKFSKTSMGFVSIQEGCNKFCTFCVVPYTRGFEFSRKVEDIFRECLFLVSHGVKEINLLGQNVSAYAGYDFQGKVIHLAHLVQHISNINGLERIRFTTSHPMDICEDIIMLYKKETKLLPFLHLPVQSGSDRILKLMNRKYTVVFYKGLIQKLILARPDIVISSDFIVGFPGETDDDFEQTLNLIKHIKFYNSYAFKYSSRPGTPASFKRDISDEIKSKRLKKIQQMLILQQLLFNQKYENQILNVLLDKKFINSNGKVFGKSCYMQTVYVENVHEDLLGQIVKVKVLSVSPYNLIGKLMC